MENLLVLATVQSLMSPAQKTKSHWPTAPTDTLGRTPCNHLSSKRIRESRLSSSLISHTYQNICGALWEEGARGGDDSKKCDLWGGKKDCARGVNLSAHKHHQKYSACAGIRLDGRKKCLFYDTCQRSWNCFHAFSRRDSLDRSLAQPGLENIILINKLHLKWFCTRIYYWLRMA
jgi:hypothetical protein